MISPETISLVRDRTDIVALIGETVRLTRKGRSFGGLCPFHKEKTPSFTVSQERGFFYCFGCKESGSAVDFMMKLHGLTFPEAVRDLAERAGIAIEENQSSAQVREANAARRAKDDLYAVNALAAAYFERCLRDGPGGHPLAHHAREELARRGLELGDPEGAVADALQAFRVGYAPHAWDGLALYLKQQGVSPLVGERVGLLVPRSTKTGHYDRFRHRLMFAVMDVMGRVVAFSGRALPDPASHELSPELPSLDPEQKPAKYMNSPESPIYTKGDHLFGLYQARQALRTEGEAILVEGNFDVVALHARGLRCAVAPLGTAFTDTQAKLLKRFAPKVVVLFDGDLAGRKATRAARSACREGGLEARVASLPDGSDPDDFTRREGVEAMRRVVQAAPGMLEHFIDDALESTSFGGAALTDQLARIRAVATLLTEENDPGLRSMAKHYADRLSSKLVVLGRSPTDLRQLERLMEQATQGGARSIDAPEARELPRDRARSRERVAEIALAVVGAVLDFPVLLEDPEVEVALGTLEGDAALTIAALRRLRASQNEIWGPELLAQIPPAIHSFGAGRLASPAFDVPSAAKTVLLENAGKLKRLMLQRENALVVGRLHRDGALGDASSEDDLLREVQRRSREKLGLV
jgi:DNA primase